MISAKSADAVTILSGSISLLVHLDHVWPYPCKVSADLPGDNHVLGVIKVQLAHICGVLQNLCLQDSICGGSALDQVF